MKNAKEITPKVFDMVTQNCINKGFKLSKQKEEKELLKDIENCKIVQISKIEDFIEIAYERNEEIKYLMIEERYSISSMAGFRTFFKFDNKKLEDSKKIVFLIINNNSICLCSFNASSKTKTYRHSTRG